MTNKQKRAISYSISKRNYERRTAFIMEHEGTLYYFEQSGYKSLLWYIRAKFNKTVDYSGIYNYSKSRVTH